MVNLKIPKSTTNIAVLLTFWPSSDDNDKDLKVCILVTHLMNAALISLLYFNFMMNNIPFKSNRR